MANINSIYSSLLQMETLIKQKGGTVEKAYANPGLSELMVGLSSIPTRNAVEYFVSESPKHIITAELPNMTINVLDTENNVIDTKNTGESGGRVELNVTEKGLYVVECVNTLDEKLWTKEIEINEDGTYYLKVGKKFNDYTWAEIKQAANGHYAKYMWTHGDRKILPSWMGCDLTACTNDQDPSTSSHYVFIASFDHDDKVDNSGKAGMTLGVPFYTGYLYMNQKIHQNPASYLTQSSLVGYIVSPDSNWYGYNNSGSNCPAIAQPYAVYDYQNNPDSFFKDCSYFSEKYQNGSCLNKVSLWIPYPYPDRNNITTSTSYARYANPTWTYLKETILNGIPDSLWYNYNTTFTDCLPQSYSYTWNYNWLTGILRMIGLENKSEFYLKCRVAPTSSTSGTYYVYDRTNKGWVQKTLPTEFTSSDVYFEKHIMKDDGPLLKCFPQELRNIMEKVVKYTYAPYWDDTNDLSYNQTLIRTEDILYMASVTELQGQYLKYPESQNNYKKYCQEKNSNNSTSCYYTGLRGFEEGTPFMSPEEYDFYHNNKNYAVATSRVRTVGSSDSFKLNSLFEITSRSRSYSDPSNSHYVCNSYSGMSSYIPTYDDNYQFSYLPNTTSSSNLIWNNKSDYKGITSVSVSGGTTNGEQAYCMYFAI